MGFFCNVILLLRALQVQLRQGELVQQVLYLQLGQDRTSLNPVTSLYVDYLESMDELKPVEATSTGL